MTATKLRKLIAQFDGWIDGEHLRFPSPAKLAAFQRAYDAATSN